MAKAGIPVEDEKRASRRGSGTRLTPDVSETRHLPLRARNGIWLLGIVVVLIAFPLNGQQHSASATSQLTLVVPSRVRVSLPAQIEFEESREGFWNSEVTAKASVDITVRGNKSAREILTAEWSLKQGSMFGVARQAEERPGRGLPDSRYRSPILSRSFVRHHRMRILSRYTQEDGEPVQVAGTTLSNLDIFRRAHDSATPANASLWSSPHEFAPDSPASLVDIPAFTKSDLRLDLEMSMPARIYSVPTITLTFTVL